MKINFLLGLFLILISLFRFKKLNFNSKLTVLIYFKKYKKINRFKGYSLAQFLIN